jgi:hypothetical protein
MDAVIQFEGTIYEQGYGLIAQQVMRDKSLPKQAKLIYSYMCSFAGTSKNGERTAFPSVALQCNELDMTEGTYYKWRKYLVDRGLIKITKQRQERAKFDRNIYSILAIPETKKDPEERKQTPEEASQKVSVPYSKNSSTADSPYFKKPSTAKPSTVNQRTNSTSITSNSLKRNTETKVTEETKRDKSDITISPSDKSKKQDQMLKNSLKHSEGLSDQLFEILDTFSENYSQMYTWIGILFRAKDRVEKNTGELLVIEKEENNQLICDGVITVIRNMRTQEKTNPEGYMFTSLVNHLEKAIADQAREKKLKENAGEYHYLRAGK